jgi:hypothetical protein
MPQFKGSAMQMPGGGYRMNLNLGSMLGDLLGAVGPILGAVWQWPRVLFMSSNANASYGGYTKHY